MSVWAQVVWGRVTDWTDSFCEIGLPLYGLLFRARALGSPQFILLRIVYFTKIMYYINARYSYLGVWMQGMFVVSWFVDFLCFDVAMCILNFPIPGARLDTPRHPRNAVAPLGLKLLKRLSSSLSPKLSMLASNSDGWHAGLVGVFRCLQHIPSGPYSGEVGTRSLHSFFMSCVLCWFVLTT